jgi:hypothetical protein
LGFFGEKNSRISKPWQECSIELNGQTKDSQMSSLRKKKNLNIKIQRAILKQQIFYSLKLLIIFVSI